MNTNTNPRFSPNARLVIKRKSVYVKLPDDPSSLLFGSVAEGTDDSTGYDERNYKRSVHKNSPLFERMGKMRANQERLCYFDAKHKRYGDEHPCEPGEFEHYADAFFEVLSDKKRILFGESDEIELTDGDTAVWRTGDVMSPELIFKKGERIACALFPQIDFLLQLNITPDLPQKNCLTYELSENICDRGGSLELGYIIELGGVEAENTRLSITLYPMDERED